MSGVSFTRRAREDLLDIWLYVASKASEAVADKVYDRIEDACRLLGDYPEIGPARPDIGEGARALVVERWLALYRRAENGAQIVRIVDGARDLAQIDFAPERERKQP